MMNQSRQSRRYCCPGGYAGIMGYGLAYWGADPRLCGREACASARSTSWGVRPLDSRKLTRCEIGELCTLGSARNETALCIISVRAGVETSGRAGAAGAFESAMLSVVLQPRRRPTRRATWCHVSAPTARRSARRSSAPATTGTLKSVRGYEDYILYSHCLSLTRR